MTADNPRTPPTCAEESRRAAADALQVCEQRRDDLHAEVEKWKKAAMTADPYGEGYLYGALDGIAVVRARYVLTPRTPAAGPTLAQDGREGSEANVGRGETAEGELNRFSTDPEPAVHHWALDAHGNAYCPACVA